MEWEWIFARSTNYELKYWNLYNSVIQWCTIHIKVRKSNVNFKKSRWAPQSTALRVHRTPIGKMQNGWLNGGIITSYFNFGGKWIPGGKLDLSEQRKIKHKLNVTEDVDRYSPLNTPTNHMAFCILSELEMELPCVCPRQFLMDTKKRKESWLRFSMVHTWELFIYIYIYIYI